MPCRFVTHVANASPVCHPYGMKGRVARGAVGIGSGALVVGDETFDRLDFVYGRR